MRVKLVSLLCLLLAPLTILAADVPPPSNPAPVVGPHQSPPWFKESFLDIKEDIAEAKRAGKRLMVYFYQNGCIYCSKFMAENFGDKKIVDKTRKHFDVIAINIWGDSEVTDTASRALPEKAFAKSLGVQFTPTLLMFDEEGKVALRLNGFVPPHKFAAALDFVGQRREKKEKFSDYVLANVREPASGKLHEQPWLMRAPLDLKPAGKKPLLVLFEQKVCAACDELHEAGFSRPQATALLDRFRMARVDVNAGETLVAPTGEQLTMREWARRLNIIYTPSLLFFDADGREVFRLEGYVRPGDLPSSLDYIASGAYLEQPEFQRFIQARIAARRANQSKQ